MEERLVSFETAKLAKLKGFDFDTSYTYNDDGFLINGFEYDECFNNSEGNIVTVTQSLLQKYLRDVYKLAVFVDCTTYVPEGSKLNNSYYWFITDVEYRNIYNTDNLESEYYDTYEQALEAGLQHALTLI